MKSIKLLIDNNASVNDLSANDETALYCALDGCDYIIKRLDRVSFDEWKEKVSHQRETPVTLKEKMTLVNLLLSKGADFNIPDSSGDILLHMAARDGDESFVLFWLSKGVNVNIGTLNGWTPLHYAAINGHVSIAKLLYDQGADINSKTGDGETPLGVTIRSCTQNREEMIEFLSQNGARD